MRLRAAAADSSSVRRPTLCRLNPWGGKQKRIRDDLGAAHSACWAKCVSMQEGKRAPTTLERLQQVQELRAQNVGLVHCALTRRSTSSSPLAGPASRSG